MNRLRAWSLFFAGSFVVAVIACTSESGSSGSDGPSGSCPCTLGNSGIQTTIGCGQSTCMALNGQVKGYRCTDRGAVEDMTVCTDPGGGGGNPGGPGYDAGPCGYCAPPQTCGGGGVPNFCGCTPQACGADGGPECGEADDGCNGKAACPACGSGDKCSESSRCLKVPKNIIVYGDYEGGNFAINVDQDLPDLAIGLVSYRPMKVTIAGAYAGNVVAVYHAGYQKGSTVTGVPERLFTDTYMPEATVDAGFGNSKIVLEEPHGGNPPAQVNAFFIDRFGGGTVKFNECRRGHDNTTMLVSAGGTCGSP